MLPGNERRARGWSLTRRLVVALSAGAFFVALVLGFLGADREERRLELAQAAMEQELTQSLADRAGPLLDRVDRLRLSVLAAVVRDQVDGRALVLDRDGKVVIDSALLLGDRRINLLSLGGAFQRATEGRDGSPVRESLCPVRFGGETIGEVRLQCLPRTVSATFDFGWFGLALLCCLSLVAVAAMLGHHWSTSVRGATHSLIRLAAGEVGGAAAEARERELQELGDAVRELERGMQDGLQRVGEGYVAMALQVVDGLERQRLVPAGHGERTARLAGRLAERLQLLPADRSELELACRLIDFGKAWVRTSILQKSGPLTEVESLSLQHHAQRAEQQLDSVPGLRRVGRILRHQLERYDGGGTPDGLRGERIPLASRVLTVASAFDLLTTCAPDAPLGWREAIERLQAARGTVFDPWLVDLFVEQIQKDPPAAEVDREVMIVPSGAMPWRAEAAEPALDDDEDDEIDASGELEVMLDDRHEDQP